MSISKSDSKKAPSQNPVDFYMMKPAKGVQHVPDQLSSAKQVEKIDGRKSLSK